MTPLETRINLLLKSYDLEEVLERLDIEPSFVIELLLEREYITEEDIFNND